MKPTLLSLCVGALLFLLPVAVFAQSIETPAQQITSPFLLKQYQPVTLPANTSRDWYNQALKNLQEREYFVRSLTGKKIFGAVNRSQQTGYRFTENGYSIKRFDFEKELAPGWQADFLVEGIGRGNDRVLKPLNGTALSNDQRLHYQYSGFTVEYINGRDGLRQNFLVSQKPAGTGDLRVQIKLEGDLYASAGNASKIYLYKKGNEQKIEMMYDGLKVWDAANRSLNAHLEVQGDNQIIIVVDDKNAQYPVTIDPLNHIPDWTDSGNGLLFPLLNDLTANVLYGTSVSSAGDVNNDNFDDLVIGSPGYVDILSVSGGTFNLVSVGAAFIYYGSAAGPSLNPTEVIQPNGLPGALFGYSVSKAGDVNGDGLDDVIIGAPGDTVRLTVAFITVPVVSGRAYVYYGSTFDGNVNTEPTPSVRLHLKQADFGILPIIPPNALYGFSVGNAGDVNGDGFADVMVGSPAYASLLPPVLGGRVDIYHGSAAGVGTTPSSKINGGLLGGLFGFSVSTAGNVNGDGFGDIIAGAPAAIGILSAGRAYVFHGSATGITATTVAGANTTIQQPGLLSQTFFGYTVSNAGDVNGDGNGDVIIGEPLAIEASLGSLVAVGQASIYYGSATGIQLAGFTSLTSPRRPGLLGLIQGNLLYGFSVSNVGDVNCDGLSDVIIGEPGGSAISLGAGLLGLVSANVLSGKAYIYYGRPGTGPLNSPSYILQETSALSLANLLGTSVSDAGDVNGDGNADLLVGAPNGTLDFSSSITGIVGSALGYITVNSIGSSYSNFGCLAAVDLDFDNDGVPDAIDLDDDNDGIPDLVEYPGSGMTLDPGDDSDGDGTVNYKDPDFPGCGGLNGNGTCTLLDKDGDGVPNSFDLDADNDGASDPAEAGGVDMDGDGILDNFIDTDSDGLTQSLDANNTGLPGSGNGLALQDADGDNISNNLDADSDGDGVADLRENGLPDTDNNGRLDGFGDTDGDGLTNGLDPKNGHSGPLDPASAGVPVVTTPSDTNNDGRYNGAPTVQNLDADLKFNAVDADSDNDGISDNVEAQATAGYVLPTATDGDANGIADIYGAGGLIPNNHDLTDNPDYRDTDTDNDGQLDVIEGHDLNANHLPDDDVALTNLDTDGDGIDNKFDLVAGVNVTNAGMGSPPVAGSAGPLQQTQALASDRDWRNGAFALPVTLVQFTGKKAGNAVQLDWITSSEFNSSHFDIERSVTGAGFASIGTVKASGGSNAVINYTFTDQSPKNNQNYYRLKMVDLDGQSTYSKVLLIRTGNGVKGIFAYPNPVRDQIQLSWQDMPAGNYMIDVMPSNGQVVRKYSVRISSDNQVMVIPRESNWRSGIYLIRVTGATGERKVVKVLVE